MCTTEELPISQLNKLYTMNVTFEKRNRVSRQKRLEQSRRLNQCPLCRDVQYKNLWYAPDSRLAQLIDVHHDKISTRLCPACDMQNRGVYEGVLDIKHIPEREYDHVVSIILHEAMRDYGDNPQHRLLDFYDHEEGYMVTATSAAMIYRIGQKIKSEFKSCEMQSQYQHEPYPLQMTRIAFAPNESF